MTPELSQIATAKEQIRDGEFTSNDGAFVVTTLSVKLALRNDGLVDGPTSDFELELLSDVEDFHFVGRFLQRGGSLFS
jgi:hypothetical protein